MSKYDVIHKTGSTRRITTPPEEDRATATVNMHNNTGKDRTCMTNTTSSSCLPKKSTIPASYLQPPITASAFGKQSISSYTANPPHRYQPPLLALHLQTALPLFHGQNIQTSSLSHQQRHYVTRIRSPRDCDTQLIITTVPLSPITRYNSAPVKWH